MKEYGYVRVVALTEITSVSYTHLSQYLDSEIKKRRSNANCVITVDREYDSFRFGREED